MCGLEPGGDGGTQAGDDGEDNGAGPGVYAGAAVAVVLLVIGIIVIIVFWRRRKPSSHGKNYLFCHYFTTHSKYSNLLYGRVSQGLGTTKFANLIG